jgi:hypothetical protein
VPCSHTHRASLIFRVPGRLLRQDACCGMCRAYKGCVAAELMGAGHPTPPYPTSSCFLFGTAGKQKAKTCPWPCGRMTVIPTRVHAN